MKMTNLRSQFLTLTMSAASLVFSAKAMGQNGIGQSESVSKIRNTEIKNEAIQGGSGLNGYGVPLVNAADEADWGTVWENQGTYILNDGGRSVPRYNAYIKKNMFFSDDKAITRPGADLSLERIDANENTQSMRFFYSAYNVRNTQTPAKKQPGQRPNFYDRGQFVTYYIVEYQDTNGDMKIDTKNDEKISETLVTRIPYASKDEKRTYNRTSFIYHDQRDPYVAKFGDYFTDANNMLVRPKDAYPTNRNVDLVFETVDVIEKYIKDEAFNASAFGTEGPRRFTENVADMIEYSDAAPENRVEQRNNQRSLPKNRR